MSAGLGSIISSPAAGMSPLRAAAVVVSDGGGDLVASPRRPQVDEEGRKPKPTSRCRTIPTDRALSHFMRPARRHHTSPSCLSASAPGQSLRSTAGLATDQNPAKTDVQSASGHLAPTPVVKFGSNPCGWLLLWINASVGVLLSNMPLS